LKALAEAYQELDSPLRAEECLDRILRLRRSNSIDPDALAGHQVFAHERLARIRALRGRNRESAAHVSEYRKLDLPGRFGRMDRILLTEALIAWIERRLKDSLKTVQDALRTYPKSQERDKMLLALGTVLHESGDDRAALGALEEMLRTYPNSTSRRLARDQIDHIKNPPAGHVH
jgi:hypothetical protein